jgi:hypothetical protein
MLSRHAADDTGAPDQPDLGVAVPGAIAGGVFVVSVVAVIRRAPFLTWNAVISARTSSM